VALRAVTGYSEADLWHSTTKSFWNGLEPLSGRRKLTKLRQAHPTRFWKEEQLVEHVLSQWNAFACRQQNASVEILEVLGRLINFTDLPVPQESDNLVKPQASPLESRPPQFFQHLPSPILGRDDEQRVV